MKIEREKIRKQQFTIVVCMGIFVALTMLWGVFRVIRAVNYAKENGTIVENKLTTKVEKKKEKNTERAKETVDLKKVAKNIISEVSFASELKLQEDSVAGGMVDLAPNSSMQIYMGNGTYADELILIEADSEDNAKTNLENVTKHLREIKNSFQDYLPEEAKKVEDAVNIRYGKYVVACVTKDSENAKKVMDKQMKQ